MTNGAGSPPGEGEAQTRRKLLGFANSPEELVMNAAFIVLFGAICWGVLSRYVVPTPATWVEEISSISFAYLIFVGAAEVQRRMQHVSVDLFTAQLPRAVQRVLTIAVNLFVVLFCFFLAYLGAKHAYASHSSKTSMLRIPLSIAAAGFTLGFLMMGVRGLQNLFKSPVPAQDGT
jgi:TRAP-type transport system small permease protein